MKSIRYALGLGALAFGLFTTTGLCADKAHKKDDDKATSQTSAVPAGKLVKITEKDAAWAAKERKNYPLTVCLSSDEKLGSMGENAEMIYREKGKPDRLVIFCCEGCGDDFVKEPAKYLAKLDAAAKKKSTGTK
jgi:hypothetical protein